MGPYGPWVPKRPQRGPTWLIVMYHTCGKCFRVIWGLPGQHLVRSSFYPSRRLRGTKNFNFAVVKNFSWICEPRPISKCKVVLDVYFRPFSSILGMVFFQKMALCEYLILVIFGQFWLFRANFGPEISKEYLFQLFRCKKDNGITKSGLIWLFGKLGSPGAPKPTLGPKTPLNGPGRAKIGVNAPHAVQLTSFGPKKTDSNRTPQRSVPFTWNQPVARTVNTVDCYYWHSFGTLILHQQMTV